MSSKYDRVNYQILDWLKKNTSNVSVDSLCTSLGIVDPHTKRHISRRFSMLKKHGALVGKAKQAAYTYDVVIEKLTTELYEPKKTDAWKRAINAQIDDKKNAAIARHEKLMRKPSIRASNSEEFLARGGKIEKLPNEWNQHKHTSYPPSHLFSSLE